MSCFVVVGLSIFQVHCIMNLLNGLGDSCFLSDPRICSLHSFRFITNCNRSKARIHDILKELNVKGIFYNSPLTSFNISSLPQPRSGAWDTNLVEMANKKRPHIPEAGVCGVDSRRRKGQLNRSPKWFSMWDGSHFLKLHRRQNCV